MEDLKVTVASLRSVLADPQVNLSLVKEACKYASDTGARLLVLPELMLTGHGGHQSMVDNAEPVPSGPLSTEILRLSREHSLCICVGIAEKKHNMVYNSHMVADRGKYLGLQRKIYLSGDEYCYFGAGESVEVFDIGEIRFGIALCYDNHFPEIALIHSLNNVDLILAPHAARCGRWEAKPTEEFRLKTIRDQQEVWEKVHRARAYDHNLYVLLCNAVGSSAGGLEGVEAIHAGTVMGIDPDGEVFLRTTATDFTDEIVTVELKSGKRKMNHPPTRNRRLDTVVRLLRRKLDCRQDWRA